MKAKSALVLIFLSMVLFKMIGHAQNEIFNYNDDTALFWTESAFQYRTAKLVAAHGRITSPDSKLQYPEGVDIRERITVLMETVTGLAYRYLAPKTVPFHIFVLLFVALVSSLSVVPLYGTIVLACRNRVAGLIGAAFYAVTPAVYTTVIAPGYEYQDFALPLIFFHIYFFVRAMKSQGSSTYSFALLSGAFLFAGFAAWHLTQFYFTLFVVFIIFSFLFVRAFDMKPFDVIAAVAVLAGYIIPAQRSAAFLVSLAMLLTYAVVIGSLIPVRRPVLQKTMTGVLIVIAGLVTAYIAFASVAEYRLVYGLILAKVTHFGIRPPDPGALPWEILVMWVSPFIEPSFQTVVFSIGGLAIAGIIGAVREAGKSLRKKLDTARGLQLFFTAIFIPLYLIFIRLDAFLVWFLAFQAGVLFSAKAKYVRAGVIALLCANAFLLVRMPRRSAGPDQNYLLGIVKYIRQHTPENSPVLTSFAYGPTIAAYTDHAILLHPKFEAEHITAKIRAFEHRLFEHENALYAFCRSYGARYLVYQTDMLLSVGTESMRYRTHNLTISRDCAAYQFHFHPEALIHFNLVYSNPHYRIYRVLKDRETAKKITPQYLRVYDETMVNISDLGID